MGARGFLTADRADNGVPFGDWIDLERVCEVVAAAEEFLVMERCVVVGVRRPEEAVEGRFGGEEEDEEVGAMNLRWIPNGGLFVNNIGVQQLGSLC